MQCGWSQLADGISAGNAESVSEFHRLFDPPVKFYLGRRIEPSEVDTCAHESLESVVRQIQQGDLGEPARLFAYTWSVVRQKAPVWRTPLITAAVARLRAMPARDREVLARFYLRAESGEKICSDMGLTGTQFRELKARACGVLA
jgi:hypothetical protein